MTREELIEILDRYNIDYKFGSKEEVNEGLKLFDESLLKLFNNDIIKCKNCIHNNNCEIQYAAQANENFGCTYGEQK